MKYKTLLFDLDGTLLDTNELIISSFLYTLDQFFPGKYTRETIIPHMGKTLYEQMVYFGNEKFAAEMVNVYREHNIRTHNEMVKDFPFVKEVLTHLYERGAIMGVVTSKGIITTEMGLKLFGLYPFMSTIVTFEDTKLHKPNPDPVLLAMEKLNAKPNTTLMVGDSQYDIQAAQNAGITSVGVAWSLKGSDFLQQFHPDYMLNDFRDLIPIVLGKEKEDEKYKTVSGQRK